MKGTLLDALLKLISGYKTYAAAIGLAGLAIYQFSQKQYDQALQSAMAALAAAGLRNAITKAAGV